MSRMIREIVESMVRDSMGHGSLDLGKTRELQNYDLVLPVSRMAWKTEEAELADLFRSMGIDLSEKYVEEEYHYQFLRYSLLQKFRAVRYFHGQDEESRKIIIFSDDCISMIQWMTRSALEKNFMNVYIRSSDIVGLLGLDLLYLFKLYEYVVEEYPQIARYDGEVSVRIMSAHLYWDREGNFPTTRDGVKVMI